MRLKSIWTLRGMPMAERVDRTIEWVCIQLSHRLPKRIQYWSFIHSVNQNIHPHEIVPEVTAMEILNRMDSHAA